MGMLPGGRMPTGGGGMGAMLGKGGGGMGAAMPGCSVWRYMHVLLKGVCLSACFVEEVGAWEPCRKKEGAWVQPRQAVACGDVCVVEG
eukprot:1070811-Pelagomonas_calceolata.AAC.2